MLVTVKCCENVIPGDPAPFNNKSNNIPVSITFFENFGNKKIVAPIYRKLSGIQSEHHKRTYYFQNHPKTML